MSRFISCLLGSLVLAYFLPFVGGVLSYVWWGDQIMSGSRMMAAFFATIVSLMLFIAHLQIAKPWRDYSGWHWK